MGPMGDLLIALGLSDAKSFEPFHPRVRDRDDVKALRCTRTGAIVLDRADHIDVTLYEQRSDLAYWGSETRQEKLAALYEDDARRAELIRARITGKKWLDVGTGLGGVLDYGKAFAEEIAAVEPQEGARKLLTDLGYQVFKGIEDAPDGHYDLITLFHVLEHTLDPVDILTTVRRKLAPGGSVVVEVPHAQDFLLSVLEVEAFRSFTLWSEHLILHTRITLDAVLAAAGFNQRVIEGFQRYPLANHLRWLAVGKPGGHIEWGHLRSVELDDAYSNMLARHDNTDTLIAWAV